MHRISFILLLTLLFLVGGTHGQQNNLPKVRQYVVAPAENTFIVIVSQPDCPLKIENAKYLIGVDDRQEKLSYQLINKGDKPIRYFSIVRWTSLGTGGTWDAFGGGEVTNKLMMPGQVMDSDEKGARAEIVPLTDKLRDSLELRGSMKLILFLMIDKVRFADGTTYNAEAASRGLQSYLENLDLKTN